MDFERVGVVPKPFPSRSRKAGLKMRVDNELKVAGMNNWCTSVSGSTKGFPVARSQIKLVGLLR